MGTFADSETGRALLWTITGLVLVATVGVVDFWTGSELAFSLFYLIPIALVTWFSGRPAGLVVTAASAMTWLAADALAGQPYSQPVIRYWNAAVRLSFFVVVTLLLPALKELEREREMARYDYLTGAANRRFCFELVQRELDRSHRYRHPFGVAYIDLDNFKTVNDQFGHKTGDEVLCDVVNQARVHLRKTDMIARVGGDEFVVLMPEADQNASQAVISRMNSALLNSMQQNRWPVTFSVGVLTCRSADVTSDELIRRADELMYSVKKGGKNAIAYQIDAG